MATFFNQATLSYAGGTVNSNVTTGELIEALSANKTAVTGTYAQNADVTYIINVNNTADTPFTGLTVTDNLGAYDFEGQTLQPLDYVEGSVNYFVNGVLQPTPAVTAGPPLVISGVTVPANGTATLLYTARTNGFAPPAQGSSITNSAAVTGNVTPIVVTETVTARAEPILSITKSLNPVTVTENGQLTYTFVIQNLGNTAAVATDNLVITDTFNPVLRDITVTYNGTPWSAPANYTYNPVTGLFTTGIGQITLPAATYTQAPNGEWSVTPGTATLTVTGTV